MIDKIFNEDCLEGMKRIADGSIDFVLTDLPFGITSNDWDVKIDLTKFWEQINRITKHNAAIALFAQMPFAVDLVNANREMFRYEWIWEKHLGCGFFNCNKMPLRCHENILIFYRKLPTYNPQLTEGKPYRRKCSDRAYKSCYSTSKSQDSINDGKHYYPRDVIKFKSTIGMVSIAKGTRYHPTQKPVDLLEYLIKTYTNEGEIVLDAAIGSGSTAVAAINTNRHFIGFETEKKFYDIAQERIAKARAEKEQALF